MTGSMEVDRTGLVGRATELAVAATLVDAAAGNGAALLLTGDPGVGKTALLNETAELAIGKGLRVIGGAGAEYEAEISFAGLHQLVSPLAAELALLPGPSRAALEVALGWGAGPAPAEMAVLHAALSLFAEAARTTPLLLIVDDLHALDRASRSVVSFVARRAGGHRIALLAALRTGITEPPDLLRMPELPVAPLADADAIRLLSRRFSGLPGRVIADVARQAQGNPLALLEFGALAGAPGLLPGDSVAAGPAREVLALYAARVAQLPADTHELLLLAALEGSGDLCALEAAAGAAGLDALAAAERDRLICTTADGRTVRFRHPLVKSAVVGQSTLEQRRAAHRRLAVVLADEPERRADHLSMATAVPDESVAAIVEAGARRSLRRGDVLGAVARLRRAAALSPDREVGGRRLAHAAYIGASVAGNLELSDQLMRELDDCPTASPSPSAAAAAAAGYMCLMTDGNAETAQRLLVKVIDPRAVGAGSDVEELSPVIFTLMLSCHYAGRAANWAPLRDLVSTSSGSTRAASAPPSPPRTAIPRRARAGATRCSPR